MLLEIHPDHPEPRKIQQAVSILEAGGVLIYPTDTVYGIGCDIFNHGAVEKVCKLRSLDPEKARLSMICKDISQVAGFAWQLENETFKLLKNNLPGPFTFILRSGNAVPKLFKNRKRTIGIRIPANKIAQALVEALGRPILSASLKIGEDLPDDEAYYTEVEDIRQAFEKQVDAVIDGGPGGTTPSTLVDCTEDVPVLVRQGAGVLR